MQEIHVAGIPFTYASDANGFYITATSQYVQIDGSPLVVRFDPPIAGTATIPVAQIVLAIVAALGAGGVIVGLA